MLFKAVCYIICWILGWKDKFLINLDEIRSTNNVFVFPHTSGFDAVIPLFNGFKNDFNLISVAWEGQFKNPLIKHFFTFMNIFPINNHGGNNAVDKICNTILEKTNGKPFLFCISPEGKRDKVDRFKSGYYYIAKKLNANILIGGVDYESHEVKIIDKINNQELETLSLEECNQRIKKTFYDVVPLYPDYTHFPCRPHAKNVLSSFDYCVFSIFLNIFALIWCYFLGFKLFAVFGLLFIAIPWLYHYYEENKELRHLDYVYVGSGIIIYLLTYQNILKVSLPNFIRLLSWIILFIMFKRAGKNERYTNPHYYSNHAIFHSSAIIIPLFEMIAQKIKSYSK